MFLDCVQRINLIQLGSNFTSDFVSWHLQLRATELRLRRWGKAAGIFDEQSNLSLEQLKWPNDSEDITQVRYDLMRILKQLSRAKEDSDEMLDDGLCKDKELKWIDQFEQLSLCGSDAEEAAQALEGLSSRYQSSLPVTRKVIERSMFALYQPDQLQRLLDAIGDHVKSLEDLLPLKLKTLVAQEASILKSEPIQALASALQQRDPILASAWEEVLPGCSCWENISNEDNAKVHLGSHYPKEPTGYFSWSGMQNGGNSRVHAGHFIGYSKRRPL